MVDKPDYYPFESAEAKHEHYSNLNKSRKNPYFHFKNKDQAKEAGDKGRQTQKAKRENSNKRQATDTK